MKHIRIPVILLFCFLLSFSSCQKELHSNDAANSGTIVGNYDLLRSDVTIAQSITMDDMGDVQKTVDSMQLLSSNPSGTYSFTSTMASTSNVNYTMNLSGQASLYDNGLFIMAIPFPPVSQPVGPINSSQAYHLIGTDSINLNIGAIPNMPALPPGVTLPTSQGARYAWHGDTLRLVSRTITDSVSDLMGIHTVIHSEAVATVKLKKR